jgi:hypothetical protein
MRPAGYFSPERGCRWLAPRFGTNVTADQGSVRCNVRHNHLGNAFVLENVTAMGCELAAFGFQSQLEINKSRTAQVITNL